MEVTLLECMNVHESSICHPIGKTRIHNLHGQFIIEISNSQQFCPVSLSHHLTLSLMEAGYRYFVRCQWIHANLGTHGLKLSSEDRVFADVLFVFERKFFQALLESLHLRLHLFGSLCLCLLSNRLELFLSVSLA